ncbi:hypothetical protein ACIBEA_42545 [Streptomyces sp. NPDC051555]|uniref:terpene synthase family protein n=1 Tax=Streptomyces sp. NPDC051555 TaxID=3365657 RepID=UPI00378C0433
MRHKMEFDIPFHCQANPGMTQALARNVDWARRVGLVVNDEEAERYIASQTQAAAAHFYPDISGEDLDLAYDMCGFFFPFDDTFDVPPGRSLDNAVAACQDLIALLAQPQKPVPQDSPPVVVAFSDFWRREVIGMSPSWVSRAAHNWAGYFYGNLTEVSNRLTGTILSPADQMNLRRTTIAVMPGLDLAERVGHFEIPALAWHSSHMQAMREKLIDHIYMLNDIYSLEKEEADGDHNLIHCIMRSRNCSQPDAIDEVVETANSLIAEFIDLTQKVPQMCRGLNLSAAERSTVERSAATIRTFFRANYDWGFSAGRYTS